MHKMKENTLIKPHGGKLNLNIINDLAEIIDLKNKLKHLPKIKLSTLEFSDLIMLGIGAFSPLNGFMNKKDYEGVIKNMRLSNGLLWPLPVTLTIDNPMDYKRQKEAALISPSNDQIVGQIKLEDIYEFDKTEEAKSAFATEDIEHPGVAKLKKLGNFHVGGSVKVFSEGGYPELYQQYARPTETRKIFESKGWRKIVAFQTRNPIHRSHEYLIKTALETADGLFIHPIVGKLKEGDIPGNIRIKCYEALLGKYLPEERVVLKVYPMEMRYAGPKEAILHAIIRQNYGCTNLIVGRDHAGVGKYYGAFEAQDIFDDLTDEDLQIKPTKMDWTFYCEKCNSMASFKTCPHSDEDHKMISGTKLREMLSNGEYPPEYITRKEVSEILIEFYQKK